MSVITLTKHNFEEEVMQSEKPVLIDFWASWCTPCKMLSPVVDQIADEIDNVKICKVNINEETDLASTFGVMNIPTLVYIKNGKVEDSIVGVKPKSDILKMIEA